MQGSPRAFTLWQNAAKSASTKAAHAKTANENAALQHEVSLKVAEDRLVTTKRHEQECAAMSMELARLEDACKSAEKQLLEGSNDVQPSEEALESELIAASDACKECEEQRIHLSTHGQPLLMDVLWNLSPVPSLNDRRETAMTEMEIQGYRTIHHDR